MQEDDVASEFSDRVTMRVVHSKPRSLKLTRMPQAVGGRLCEFDVAVTTHIATGLSEGAALPCVSISPNMSGYGSRSVQILRGLEGCSSSTLCRQVHSWTPVSGLRYSFKDIKCIAEDGLLEELATMLVSAGAFATAAGSSIVEVPFCLMGACRELIDAGYVCRCDDDAGCQLTARGAARIDCVVQLGNPRPVCAVRRDLPLEDLSTFELLMLLNEQCWSWRRLPRKKAHRLALSYRSGGDKHWYSGSVTLHKPYLLVLLKAGDIFGYGIEAIPHWSPKPVEDYSRLLLGSSLYDKISHLID